MFIGSCFTGMGTGGCCTGIATAGTRVLIDAGAPLPGEQCEPIRFPQADAGVVTHYHGDHIGDCQDCRKAPHLYGGVLQADMRSAVHIGITPAIVAVVAAHPMLLLTPPFLKCRFEKWRKEL